MLIVSRDCTRKPGTFVRRTTKPYNCAKMGLVESGQADLWSQSPSLRCNNTVFTAVRDARWFLRQFHRNCFLLTLVEAV